MLALCDAYITHLRARIFPGGCFFATAALEMGSRPGPVRDRIAEFQRDFMAITSAFVRTAHENGDLLGEDPAALSFEINGQFLAANAGFNLTGDPGVLDLATAILHRRLDARQGRHDAPQLPNARQPMPRSGPPSAAPA